MTGAFSPILQADLRGEQPVVAASPLEGLADLGKLFLGAAANAPTPRQPTKDERFSNAVRKFEEAKGGSFSWNRQSIREFAFNFPEFIPEIKGFGEMQGVMEKTPEEVAKDTLTSFASTPEGIVAVLESQKFSDPSEREAFFMQRASQASAEVANLTVLQRQVSTGKATEELVPQRWNTVKDTSRNFVNGLVQTQVRPVLERVLRGETVPLSPDDRAMLGGVGYEAVTLQNLPSFLQDARVSTKRMLSENYLNKTSDTLGSGMMPKDWEEDVLGEMNALVKLSESVDSPQKIAAAMKALVETSAIRELDAKGLSLTLYLAQNMPPEVTTRLLRENLRTLSSVISEVGANQGRVFGYDTIKQNTSSLSKEETELAVGEALKMASSGAFVPEAFAVVVEGKNRMGFDALSGKDYKNLITQHGPAWKKYFETTQTADALKLKEDLGVFLTADIQKSVDLLQSRLGSQFSLVRSGGKYTVEMKPEAQQALAEEIESAGAFVLPNMTVEARTKAAIDRLPKDMTINDLNEKYNSLRLLGDFGKQVEESFTGGVGQTKLDGGAGADALNFDWSRFAVGGAAERADSFTKLDPNYASRVAALVQAAEQELGPRALTITSAYRSNELQDQLFRAAVKKYGSEAAARKWVAPAGRSKHNFGLAVDFGDKNGRLLRDPNSREAKWIKANAARFGLNVPMSWEPWQVELAGSRGGGSSANSSVPFSTGDVTSLVDRTRQEEMVGGVTFQMGESTGGPEEPASLPDTSGETPSSKAEIASAVRSLMSEPSKTTGEVSEALMSQVTNIFVAFGDSDVTEDKVKAILETIRKG
jgi:hypothetical protein